MSSRIPICIISRPCSTCQRRHPIILARSSQAKVPHPTPRPRDAPHTNPQPIPKLPDRKAAARHHSRAINSFRVNPGHRHHIRSPQLRGAQRTDPQRTRTAPNTRMTTTPWKSPISCNDLHPLSVGKKECSFPAFSGWGN